MKSFHVVVSRLILLCGVLALAACQTAGDKQAAPGQPPVTPQTGPQAPAVSQPSTPTPPATQGASVAVFLADTVEQQGWTPVQIQSGMLYVNPQPVITREDLVGVKAGRSPEGDGLLALALSDAGSRKVESITRNNPQKRLALVVGRTMLAAPTYSTPVTSDQLVFIVGSEQNATEAARAIVGPNAVPQISAPGQ